MPESEGQMGRWPTLTIFAASAFCHKRNFRFARTILLKVKYVKSAILFMKFRIVSRTSSRHELDMNRVEYSFSIEANIAHEKNF